MTAPHFFLDALDADVLRIRGDDARHAARVLRIRAGEEITVADGRGGVARARVVDADAREVAAEVSERWVVAEDPPAIVAHPAVPKSGKLDLEVQKLTEIGVAEIRPWIAARSVPRWDDAKRARQGERLRAIAREAAKQSRSARIPLVADPGRIDSLPEPSFLLHEEEAGRLRDVLPAEPPERVGILTGPEGGLEPKEIRALRDAGAIVVGLGPRVLRTETAVIVGCALVAARYGQLG